MTIYSKENFFCYLKGARFEVEPVPTANGMFWQVTTENSIPFCLDSDGEVSSIWGEVPQWIQAIKKDLLQEVLIAQGPVLFNKANQTAYE